MPAAYTLDIVPEISKSISIFYCKLYIKRFKDYLLCRCAECEDNDGNQVCCRITSALFMLYLVSVWECVCVQMRNWQLEAQLLRERGDRSSGREPQSPVHLANYSQCAALSNVAGFSAAPLFPLPFPRTLPAASCVPLQCGFAVQMKLPLTLPLLLPPLR